MAKYFDRYSDFRYNSEVTPIPGLSIEKSNSDKTMVYKIGVSG